jgi:transcriptional regulator with GAF, ATPase, and Fis domain
MAESYLGRIALGSCDARTSSRRSAILARIALDRGQPEQPITILRGTEATAATAEVLALTHDALGQKTQARSELERGRLLAEDDEERARMEGVAGVLAHREDDSAGELSAYRAAAKHAQRAGAVLEEATYLSGVAAAATQLGELGEALSAAQRSTLLFEYLGRGKEAARAALARVAAYAHVGAEAEAREAAMDALRRAKSMRDPLCQGYVHLALAIALPAESAEAADQAERAWLLLREGQPADRLWAAARMLRSEKGELDLPELDRLARQSSISVPARLDWWGARARAALSNPTAAPAASVVAELIALSTVRAAPAVRGPSLAAGGELATRLGDGEAARRLASAAAEAARELMARVPDELKVAVEGLEWVRAVKAPSEGVFSPEQLKNVEALVRALGHRDRLKTLLGQVLDALVLWTGVERGLLLLRAPGGRLRPRVARNLAREDLSREQLELSYSLAERALALGEPVVAVDAAGELPEVHQSVHALKLRSVLAVPLVAHGQALGVVYLDDRGRRGAFGPRELGWVRLIATLAAVAIADARDQLLLRRAARKAERAQALLADELARREAELDAVARELARSRDARETRFSYEAIIGQSEPVRRMLRVVDRVVASEVPVLIFGESGSGKELVARAIHEHGPRKGAPFVTENCSAIPESLLESALFGHVRGAFTGALRPRAGLFEIADRGTLFLDEIGEMSLRMQSELLRVLEDGEIRPVGSERLRKVDVRVIGATHRNLEELVREKRFREDLFYRLNVISVRVPTLRERPGDIPLLVRHMISAYAKGRRVRISKVALDSLTACLWPGNVRQLQNEIRRALVLADDVIELEHLSADVRGSEGPSSDDLNVRGRLDALETELVKSALERTQGNQTRAAELLGVSRFGLHKMMRRLEIEWQERRSAG